MSRTVTVPDWLDASFLQTVLQHDVYRDKGVKVRSVEVRQAVPPGANYASDIFRIRCKYCEEDDTDQAKDISLLVKVKATNEFLKNLFDELGFSEKEYIAYSRFLPEIYKVLPNSERFTAKLLYSTGPQCLVLEDLKDQGFVMADRLKQLDFEHCLVCMETMAKLHAASVAIIKNKPEFIVTLGKETMFGRDGVELYEKQRDTLKKTAMFFPLIVQCWDGFEDFEEKSRRVWETLHDDLCDAFEPRKDSLNVMNHGDLWTNNMLFKYDSDGNIVDFRIVDFQVCRYASPASDILYFLFTSGNREVRENNLDELLTAYLETLNSVLEQLDCEERLTREQLDADLKRTQCYVLAITFSMLTAVFADPDDLVNWDEVNEGNISQVENNPLLKVYQGKYYKVFTSQVISYLYKVGFFDR